MTCAAASPRMRGVSSSLSSRGDPGTLWREDRGDEMGDTTLLRRGNGDESLSCCNGDDGGVWTLRLTGNSSLEDSERLSSDEMGDGYLSMGPFTAPVSSSIDHGRRIGTAALSRLADDGGSLLKKRRSLSASDTLERPRSLSDDVLLRVLFSTGRFVSSLGGVDPEPHRRLAKLNGDGLKSMVGGDVKVELNVSEGRSTLSSSSGVTGGSSSSEDDAVETRGLAQACKA